MAVRLGTVELVIAGLLVALYVFSVRRVSNDLGKKKFDEAHTPG
jgi:hypothetical protein